MEKLTTYKTLIESVAIQLGATECEPIISGVAASGDYLVTKRFPQWEFYAMPVNDGRLEFTPFEDGIKIHFKQWVLTHEGEKQIVLYIGYIDPNGTAHLNHDPRGQFYRPAQLTRTPAR